MSTPHSVESIVTAAGGRIAGRTRLQKSAYLLEAAGAGFGFDFSYHYYGPFSDDLAVSASDADALSLISMRREYTQAGLPYTVYEIGGGALREDDGSARRRELLQILNRYDSISLELAATAHFLSRNGFAETPWAETKKRKSMKATPDRVAKARRLLEDLNIGVVSDIPHDMQAWEGG